MFFGEFSAENTRDFVQRERQSPAHFPLQIFDQLAVEVVELDPTTATECEQHGGEVEGAVQHVVAVGEFGVFAVLRHVFVVAEQRVSDLKFHALIHVWRACRALYIPNMVMPFMNGRTYINTGESGDERTQDLIRGVTHPARRLFLALINARS